MTHIIRPTPSLSQRVKARLDYIEAMGETPHLIWFSSNGYGVARAEEGSLEAFGGQTEYMMRPGEPATYMGISYVIGPMREDSGDNDFMVITAEAVERAKPPPPTEHEVALEVLESCLEGMEDDLYRWDVRYDETSTTAEGKRQVWRDATVGEHRFRIIVEIL